MTEEQKNSQAEQNSDQPDSKPAGDKRRQDKTRPMQPYEAPESGGPAPDIDEGPPPEPVDDIQEALVEAADQGDPTELKFDELPEPVPDLDEGPTPRPVDDIQEAIFAASEHGAPTEVEFDALPEPGDSGPKKVIRFDRPKPPAAEQPEAREFDKAEPKPEPTAPTPKPEPDPPPAAAPPLADFWPLLALFLVFRWLTLFLLKPGGFIRDWSDFDTYLGIAGLSDFSLYPFLDFWLEWPPLVPWLMVGAYKLALLLPPWPDDPRLWFVLILGTVFVLFEVGNFALIYRLARRFIQTPAILTRVMWLYAGLFPPVYAMLGFFDGTALFFILLSLELLLADRRLLSAASTGVGFMVKIVPALMLPVALRRLWFQYRHNRQEMGIEIGLYAVVFGLTVAILLTPFIIVPALNGDPQWWITSFQSILGRSGWETVWAVADGYYGFGAVNGNRMDPEAANFALDYTPRMAGWLWGVITLAFAALYAFIFTRPADYNRSRNVMAFGGLTIAIFMLWSKGYSPQFLVYLLPFIILLFPNGRGLTYALVLTGLNVLEQPVYFVLLPQAAWLLVLIVLARFLVITMLAVEFAVEIWGSTQPLASMGQLRPYVPLALGGLFAVFLVMLTPVMLRAYSDHRLDNSPAQNMVGFMQAQAQNGPSAETCPLGPESQRLYVSDQATYRQLYPHLNNAFDLRIAADLAELTNAPENNTLPTMSDLMPNSGLAWIVPNGPQAGRLQNLAAQQGRVVETFDFESFAAASLYNFSSTTAVCHPMARFSNGIDLHTFHTKVTPGEVVVTLFWEATTSQNQDLTVFTHLLDANGQWVAGHDSFPQNGAAPTGDWTPGVIQADTHRIAANLPPGEYTVVTGLYNNARVRLSAFGISGIGFEDRSVPLTTLQIP